MLEVVIPERAVTEILSTTSAPDDPLAVFQLLQAGTAASLGRALITIVETEGGSARSIGAQMAVLADGRYCGYISGGCLEAVIATEALASIKSGGDTMLRFGVGSPFLDIALPCGGSIQLHVHIDPDPGLVADAIRRLGRRELFAIGFEPTLGLSSLICPLDPARRSGWHEDSFVRVYAPNTRLLLLGRGLELEHTARIAAAAGLEVAAFCADDTSAGITRSVGAATTRLTTPSPVPPLPIDRWTAVVCLFHDHHWETGLLQAALSAEPFYIGALGSHRTHRARCAKLRDAGIPQPTIDRIKGPIGLFGPTRDATSLAFSILAEITDRRLAFDQH